MNLLNIIPIGKEYKETRTQLMNKAGITDINTFRTELSQLRKKYIVAFDEGYYLPANKEEYLEFIKKLNRQAYDITRTIALAYQEMEELIYV